MENDDSLVSKTLALCTLCFDSRPRFNFRVKSMHVRKELAHGWNAPERALSFCFSGRPS